MVDITSCTFQVSDPNGGAAYRPFTFSTTEDGSGYVVAVSFDGGSPATCTLSKARPTGSIHVSGARVYPSGTLTLASDAGSTVAITFTGTLYTNAPLLLAGVPIAVVD